MKSKKIIGLLGILFIFMLVGCTRRMIDFTIISSKNIDLSRAAEFTRGRERVMGRDTAYIIVFVPTGTPHVKEALDRAIEKVPGAVALVDGVVLSRSWYALVVGANSFIVEGTPLIDKSLLSGKELPSNYMISYYDDSKKEQRLVYLTKAEYLNVKIAIQEKDAKTLEEILLKN